MDIKLWFGDCLILMKNIPNKSVDLILCDLPFGMTAPKWDKIIDFNLLWQEYNRIIKSNGSIVLFSSQPFTTKLINSNEKDFKYCWYWVKNQGTNFFHTNKMPIRKIEEICVFKNGNYYPQMTEGHPPTNNAIGSTNGEAYHGGQKKRNYIGGTTTRFPTNVLFYKCVNNYKRLHSSEKPVDLLKYFIKTYTLEEELVLDNTMGSCSTGEACIETNRNFIGIENKKNNFDKSTQRITKLKSNYNFTLMTNL